MTASDPNEEQPASLSTAHVYRLIALEQVAMERRVAEKRARSAGRIDAFSNVIHLKAHAAQRLAVKTERLPLRRSG